MSQTELGGLSLAEIPLGTWVIAGSPDLATSHTRRLAELGLRAGSRVRVLFSAVGGGKVIEAADGRIALDRATCSRIPVTFESQP